MQALIDVGVLVALIPDKRRRYLRVKLKLLAVVLEMQPAFDYLEQTGKAAAGDDDDEITNKNWFRIGIGRHFI